MAQGRIQDLIRGGAPDRDRPKTAILGPQFCRILVLGPHFWWSGGGPGPPPGSAPDGIYVPISFLRLPYVLKSEYPQIPAVHCVFIPLIISSHPSDLT